MKSSRSAVIGSDPVPAPAASLGGAFISWPAPVGVETRSTLRSALVGSQLNQDFSPSFHHAEESREADARRQLLRQLAGLPSRLLWLKQVHGNRVLNASEAICGAEADGLWTSEENLALVIKTADCVPVLLATEDGTAVGALHAGWRGLAGGIIDAAVDALPCPPEHLQAWIGPAISQKNYEVGDEVRLAFLARDLQLESFFIHSPQNATKPAASPSPRWLADLSGIAERQFRERGLTQIHHCGLCTFAHPELFFSYRRGDRHKFILTLIWRQSAPAPN